MALANPRKDGTAWTLATLALFAVALVAQDRARARAKRAAPPKFDPAEVSQVFFPDAFGQVQGDRPDSFAPAGPGAGPPAGPAAAAGAAAPSASAPPGSKPVPAAAGTGNAGWSKLISASTLEDELKKIQTEVGKNVGSLADFTADGHQVIHREFSILALLFAVIAEYDGDVRFQKDAAAARDLFARTAKNTADGGDAKVFGEVKQRKADLDQLLSGKSLTARPAGGPIDWSTTVSRSSLMQLLKSAHQQKVNKALSSQDSFSENGDQILHAAELVAVVGSVLTKPGMTDSNEETYVEFAKSLQVSASDIAAAVKAENFEQAREAAVTIDQACTDCHEGFR